MSGQIRESVRRLNFSLPKFLRVSWVSDEARKVWQPRLQAITKARPRIFVQVIQDGSDSVALLQLTDAESGELERWMEPQDNYALVRFTPKEAVAPDNQARLEVAVGRRADVNKFAAAWRDGQTNVLDDLRGLPHCCRAFRNTLHNESKLVDPVFSQALNSFPSVIEDGVVTFASPPSLNLLPDILGVLPLAHMPCSFSCDASRKLAQTWVETGRAKELAEEMDHLEELMSWPMEWSSLHGIAEIKLPIFKVSANTDAFANTLRVRINSIRYPSAGVTGLHFPFRPPHSTKVTSSKSFAGGLSNPIRELNVLSAKQSPDTAPVPATQLTDQRILRLNPRRCEILDETLARLAERVPMPGLKIETIFLSNYFNVIRLNNGSTGACMNYFRFKSAEAGEKTSESLLERVSEDPLLLNYVNEGDEPDLLQLSLKTCVASALSQDLLKNGGNFRVTSSFDQQFFPPSESAVVIGFGGYMDYLIHMTPTKRIHVSDTWIRYRGNSIQRRLDLCKARFPDKVITFSDGSDNRERLASADLACITGSAFCSGTMDGLLEDARHCKTIIIQGQSAAVFPEVLFERGVSLVSTSLKPTNLVELARSARQEFRVLMEGKLPKIYLEPLLKNVTQPYRKL